MPRHQQAVSNEELAGQIRELDTRLDKLETRINYLFGGLAVLITLANLVIPVIEKGLLR